jgi:hypothetical protein
MAMAEAFRGHEFDALKCRFENQTEQLHRMTLIDLRVFSGYITVQLALGAWLATNRDALAGVTAMFGLMVIDLVLAVVAAALLYNNYQRRKEVTGMVRNCTEALGFETDGIYLDGRKLNVPTSFRPWVGWYFAGIVAAFLGVALVVFGNAS